MLERAVVNAGPLVALSLAGRLDLLPALFNEFWIPETVYREVAIARWACLGPGASIHAGIDGVVARWDHTASSACIVP